jgi:hypothetical protein
VNFGTVWVHGCCIKVYVDYFASCCRSIIGTKKPHLCRSMDGLVIFSETDDVSRPLLRLLARGCKNTIHIKTVQNPRKEKSVRRVHPNFSFLHY